MSYGFARAMFYTICRLSSDGYSDRQLQPHDLVDRLLLFKFIAGGGCSYAPLTSTQDGWTKNSILVRTRKGIGCLSCVTLHVTEQAQGQ
jgi:hypothetical protein